MHYGSLHEEIVRTRLDDLARAAGGPRRAPRVTTGRVGSALKRFARAGHPAPVASECPC